MVRSAISMSSSAVRLSEAMRTSRDGSPFYVCRNLDAKGTSVDHNTVHDADGQVGYYIDNSSGHELWPRAGSPAIDAGETVDGVTGEVRGDGAGQGAYEYGRPSGRPAAGWRVARP